MTQSSHTNIRFYKDTILFCVRTNKFVNVCSVFEPALYPGWTQYYRILLTALLNLGQETITGSCFLQFNSGEILLTIKHSQSSF